MIAWEGYLQPQWVKPFEKASRLHDPREVRRLVRRDGDADALGRRRPVRHGLGLRRRQPAPDLRQGRAGGRPIEGAGLQELRQGLPVAAEQHGRREALRHLAAVGPEHAALQHEAREARPHVVVGHLQHEVQGQGHRPGQPDPDRRRRAVSDEDAAVTRDQGSRTSSPRASSTPRSTCSSSRSR